MATRTARPRPAPATEAQMISLLRRKYAESGSNGPSTVFMSHVRSAAGFDAKRTIDAITVGLWPSRGLLVTGFEIKCSRSDWLSELKKPEKAEEFIGLVDRFYVVAGSRDIVLDGELPEGWGLLVRHGTDQLREVVIPQMLHPNEPADGGLVRSRLRPLPPRFGRSFLAALLRSAQDAATAGEEARIQARIERDREYRKDHTSRRLEQMEQADERAAKQIKALEDALGIRLKEVTDGWGYGLDPAEVGRTLKLLLEGGDALDQHRQALERTAATAEKIAAASREALKGLEPKEEHGP